ncbi:siderophore biosynthesis protein [Agaricicola taiwanensis]|uniref:Siderophore biosynthesis protein n=1 Tax=Agaricicola taiwanensis TaxID=591372 RepID=A0A8J3DXT6_9RHOB|nr:siderophore biosynthesis protein [Agaricicola taiwanensis]
MLRQLVSALIYEKLLRPKIAPAGPVRHMEWELGGQTYRCRATIGAFGRVRVIAGSIEARDEDGGWLEAELAGLVNGLTAAAPDRERLLIELQRTAALCAWNDRHLPPRSRRCMSFADIDCAIDEGHPYHPSFKARIGFNEADHRAYGPEAGNSFQLVWLAVRHDLLHQALPAGEAEFWHAELGDQSWRMLSRRRDALELTTSHGFLPLHPWQWNELKHQALAPYLADDRIRCLGFAGDHYRASQSVRTLFNAEHPERASVKLAMNLINTSARRTIEPHSVEMAPVISQWLSDVIASDPLFKDRYPVAVLREYAGIIADRDGPLGGQLAAIWRESAETKLGPGEAAVPLNALMVIEKDGKPLIEDWVLRHGLSRWLDRFLDVAILPVWHLLVSHGIATECHGQNMILVHRDGLPVRLILRDFHESVEYVPGFLADPSAAPDFLRLNPAYRDAAPNQYYWMETTDWLLELTMDCLFIFNLAEISHLLQECYGLPEEHFWLRVRNRLSHYATEHGMAERQARLDPHREEISTEALLARKLRPAAPDHQHRVPNILGTPALKIAKAS